MSHDIDETNITVPDGHHTDAVDGEAHARAATRDMTAAVREAVREELDEVLPHVVGALKANDAVAALAQRLTSAERQLSERNARPLIAGIRKVLKTARRLEYDPAVKATMVAELESLLVGAGYTEFGEVGEPFVPGRHRALEGETTGDGVVVVEIFEPGLETLGEIVVAAQVRVGSSSDVNETGDT